MRIVGRERERALISGVVDGLARGHGRAIGFAAAPGMGKTTLLGEAVSIARAKSLAAAWGVAWDGAGAPVFWPVVQALRGLAATSKSADTLLDAARFLSSNTSADGHDPPDARARVFERTTSALFSLGAPALIALDDLHAADTATLELLAFSLRATRGAPIAWVLAWRNVEVGDRSAAQHRALASLARELESHALQPLDPSELAELANAELEAPLAASSLDALHARTLGNPLFAVELLRHGDRSALPDTVRQAWASRIDRLDPAARDALRTAAILGDELRLSALAAMLGVKPEAALARIAEPIKDGLVADEGGTRFRFAHPLVRESVLETIPAREKLELHAKAGSVLATLDGIPQSAIAHHLLEAGPLIDPARAFSAAKNAADAAANVGADDDAASILDRAATILHDAPPAVRMELAIARTHALLRAGRHQDGFAAADRALELARTSEDPTAMARAALARGLEIQAGVIDPILIRALEEAEARLTKGPSVMRAHVMARLAAARQPAPNPEEPIATARDAVAMARASGASTRELAVILFNAGSAMVQMAGPEERLVLDEQTYDTALAAGERAFAIRAALRLVLDHLDVGDLEAAERWGERARVSIAEVKTSRWRWIPFAVDAMLRHARGDLRAALTLNEALLSLAKELGDVAAMRSAYVQRMGLLRDAGSLDDLRANADASASVLAAMHNHRVGRLMEAGTIIGFDRERARAMLADMTFDPLRGDGASAMLASWGDIAFATRDVELARAMLPVLDRCDRRWITWGVIGMFCDGSLDRTRAQLLLVLGRDAEARELLARAKEEHRAKGMLGALPRLELASAREPMLEQRGELWILRYEGRTHHLKDQKGLGMLARLLDKPDAELHALELMDAIDTGDAGETIDATAKERYRKRLRALEAELEDASGEHREELLEEKDAIARELSRGLGLSGQTRRTGAAAERARVNVQRRIRGALEKIAEVEPELGRHLETTVSTGLFCSYRPKARG